MKKILIISIVVHVILLGALAPWLKTRMEFDHEKEAQRTEEVKKREMERKEQERLRRERLELDERTAEMLKREAEQRNKEEISQQVKELRKLRDEMMERRDEELERFRKRNREDILTREKVVMDRLIESMKHRVDEADKMTFAKALALGSYQDAALGINGQIDDFRIYRRILGEEEIVNFTDLPGTFDHRWDFEEGVVEAVTGKKGSLEGGAAIVEREDGGGSSLQGNAKHGRAQLGLFELGGEVTLSLWARLDPQDWQQVLFTNTRSGDCQSGVRLLVEDGGTVTILTADRNSPGSKTASVAGAFPFDRWVNLVFTINRQESVAAIFIDGRRVELVEERVAKDFYTRKLEISELKDMSDKVAEIFKEENPAPENSSRLMTTLDEVKELIDSSTEELVGFESARNMIGRAKEDIEEIQEMLGELVAKVDLPVMNDTATAKAGELEPPPVADERASAAEMYQEATALERQIAEAKADVDAAREAASLNTSYADARENVFTATPERPDLATALAGPPPSTIGELNEFRDNLSRAENEMQDMNARAESAIGREATREVSAASFATQAEMSSAAMQSGVRGELVDMTSFGRGPNTGDSSELRRDESGEGMEMAFSNLPPALNLDEGKIIRAAMPGRRFTRDSMRQGWLYLDTWYVIGPWENNGTVDYTHKHPPEFELDFDARYYDGKFAAKPGHPGEVLKWEFYQSDQVRCQPPRVYANATYYAYTDVWFEQARDMLIAVASDDAASVWLNGQVVWQDTGQSAWQLGEGYRKVHFREGFNEIMVRIENGPANCVWSVVLCPPAIIGR